MLKTQDPFVPCESGSSIIDLIVLSLGEFQVP